MFVLEAHHQGTQRNRKKVGKLCFKTTQASKRGTQEARPKQWSENVTSIMHLRWVQSQWSLRPASRPRCPPRSLSLTHLLFRDHNVRPASWLTEHETRSQQRRNTGPSDCSSTRMPPHCLSRRRCQYGAQPPAVEARARLCITRECTGDRQHDRHTVRCRVQTQPRRSGGRAVRVRRGRKRARGALLRATPRVGECWIHKKS